MTARDRSQRYRAGDTYAIRRQTDEFKAAQIERQNRYRASAKYREHLDRLKERRRRVKEQRRAVLKRAGLA